MANLTARTPRPWGRALLLTLPMLVWSLLMFSRLVGAPGLAIKAASGLVLGLVLTLFFLSVRTGATHRWRRVFFVALGVLFPIGFIGELLELRGSMAIPLDRMISGDTPFCPMAVPMVLLPAALGRTVIFPGSILPTETNPHAVAPMLALWLLATVVLGKGWCSFGCFFGGLEEGFSALAPRPKVRRADPRWRLIPWAVLAAIVLLSLATYEPFYCAWLCPFKAITEYEEIRSVKTAIQTGVFLLLFLALVVVLPILTKRRTQCAWFCPFGAFQSLFNKLNVFEVRIDRATCVDCVACRRACPTLDLDAASIAAGKTLLSCMRCGACVDACHPGAARFHVKGTPLTASPETARLLYLYAGWGFAVLFGGSIMARSLARLFQLLS